MALEIVNGEGAVHAALTGGATPPEEVEVRTVPGEVIDALALAPHAAVGQMWDGRVGIQAGIMEAIGGLLTLVTSMTAKGPAMTPVDAALLKLFHDQGLMLSNTMAQQGPINPYVTAVMNLTPSYAKTAGTNLPAIVDHIVRAVATLRGLIDDMSGYIIMTRADIQKVRDLAAPTLSPEDLAKFDAIVDEIEVASRDAIKFQLRRLADVIDGAAAVGVTDEDGKINTLVLAEPKGSTHARAPTVPVE
jgi:hypothetical protein